MRPLALLTAALLSLLLMVACDDDGDSSTDQQGGPTAADASGDTVTKEFDLENFTSVEAMSAFTLEITQAEAFAVTVVIEESLQDQLDVSVENETLMLGLTGPVDIEGDVTLEATISMPLLEGLTLSGASGASLSGITTTAKIDVVLSGASAVAGDVQARDVTIEASGASGASLEGTAVSMSIDASGASNLDLAGFAVETAEVVLSGASGATINARARIDAADVSGASRLRYLGDPDLGDVKTTGASTVEAVDG